MLRISNSIVLLLLYFGFMLGPDPSIGYLLGSDLQGCWIPMNGGLPDPQPLLLHVGSSNGYEFYLPRHDKQVYFPTNGMVRLTCSGTGNYFTQIPTSGASSNPNNIIATCVDGTKFLVYNREYDFESFTCNETAKYEVKRTNKRCYNSNYLVEVGFLAGNDFINIIDICFEPQDLNVLWTKFDLVSVINGSQTNASRKNSFDDPHFFTGMQPDVQYKKTTQIATFASLLGETNTSVANRLFYGSELYLARGHLTAKADFVYDSQQRATFLFINVAPQWQSINNGNWKRVEANVRNFASRYNGRLVVYTGTHNVVRYKNVSNEWIDMALYIDRNNSNPNQIPVPALFWKVVHDTINKKGVGIFCVNNPHLSREDFENPLIYSVCESDCPNWVTIGVDVTNQIRGIIYCCDHTQIQTALPSLPQLELTSLLD